MSLQTSACGLNGVARARFLHLPETTKQTKNRQNVWRMVFKTMDIRQKRPAEIWETNKISSKIAPGYCFERLSRQQTNTEQLKLTLADILSWREQTKPEEANTASFRWTSYQRRERWTEKENSRDLQRDPSSVQLSNDQWAWMWLNTQEWAKKIIWKD